MTSAYLASRSARFDPCSSSVRSAQASATTIGRKPCCSASVARGPHAARRRHPGDDDGVDARGAQRRRQRGAEERRGVLLDHDRLPRPRPRLSSPSRRARPSAKQRRARAPCGRTARRRRARPRSARRCAPPGDRAPGPRQQPRVGVDRRPDSERERAVRLGVGAASGRSTSSAGRAPQPTRPENASPCGPVTAQTGRFGAGSPVSSSHRSSSSSIGGPMSNTGSSPAGPRASRSRSVAVPRVDARRRSATHAVPPGTVGADQPAPHLEGDQLRVALQRVTPAAAAPGDEVQHVTRPRPGRRGTCWAAPRGCRRPGRATWCRGRPARRR